MTAAAAAAAARVTMTLGIPCPRLVTFLDIPLLETWSQVEREKVVNEALEIEERIVATKHDLIFQFR